MINLAMLLVYNGTIKEDLTKALVMVISVFVFAFAGFGTRWLTPCCSRSRD